MARQTPQRGDGSKLTTAGFRNPAMTYQAIATVRDEFGLSSELTVEMCLSNNIPMATQQNFRQPSASGFSPPE